MKNRLLIKLCAIIAVGTVLLFWAVDVLTQKTEQGMSFIDEEHQQQLLSYAQQAQDIMLNQGDDALFAWLNALQEKEQTWAAVVAANVTPLANGRLSEQFIEGFRLGRNVEWKIHLYFKDNPIMDVPFDDGISHFLIQLPQRMRPGAYFRYADIALQIALPFILLSLLSWVVYQHIMAPLRKLEKATRKFSEGNFDIRVNTYLEPRNDELTALADTFDHMAERTSHLITNQRQLLADLSHELRTPLARIDMAVDLVEQGLDPAKALKQLRYDSSNMRQLIEDTLTLAWLHMESPQLNTDSFDLCELINVICEDARFEYPDKHLHTVLAEHAPIDHAPIDNSGQRALGQALENIIRNALHHTPANTEVSVCLKIELHHYVLCVQDQGLGVPEALLEDIFKPFFRVDKSRKAYTSAASMPVEKGHRGFGLGLALAQRQIAAVGGSVLAENHYTADNKVAGLSVSLTLPC